MNMYKGEFSREEVRLEYEHGVAKSFGITLLALLAYAIAPQTGDWATAIGFGWTGATLWAYSRPREHCAKTRSLP